MPLFSLLIFSLREASIPAMAWAARVDSAILHELEFLRDPEVAIRSFSCGGLKVPTDALGLGCRQCRIRHWRHRWTSATTSEHMMWAYTKRVTHPAGEQHIPRNVKPYLVVASKVDVPRGRGRGVKRIVIVLVIKIVCVPVLLYISPSPNWFPDIFAYRPSLVVLVFTPSVYLSKL